MSKLGKRLINAVKQEREKYMRKYYFGWFSFHGMLSPAAWYAENGVAIGSPSTPIIHHEITPQQFIMPLSELEKLFPKPTLPVA